MLRFLVSLHSSEPSPLTPQHWAAAAVRTSVLLAAVAVALGCAHGRLKLGATPEGEVVEAEGWAPVAPQDPIGTRQRALADAQKKAVEKVLGVYISAKTRVEQAITVDQKILANVDGYIRRYDVLGDREEGGIHKTAIRALVLYKKLGEDLKGAGLVRPEPPPGNPRVAVFVRSEGSVASESGNDASAAIRRALLEHGFAVMDLTDPMSVSKVVRSTAAAASMGLKMQADLMVMGGVQNRPIDDPRLGDFHSSRARLRVQVTKPGTGEVVTEKTQEASAIDPSADIAAAKAMENAGQLLGEALASELSANLKARTSVTVRVSGMPALEPVERFIEDLRGIPEVAQAALAAYQDGVAEVTVVTDKMPGEELAAAILRMKQYRLRLRDVTSYEVELEGS